MSKEGRVSKKTNPQVGDLIELTTAYPDHKTGERWIVTDFFPWGLHGRHAWVILNPVSGTKKVIVNGDWKLIKEQQ